MGSVRLAVAARLCRLLWWLAVYGCSVCGAVVSLRHCHISPRFTASLGATCPLISFYSSPPTTLAAITAVLRKSGAGERDRRRGNERGERTRENEGNESTEPEEGMRPTELDLQALAVQWLLGPETDCQAPFTVEPAPGSEMSLSGPVADEPPREGRRYSGNLSQGQVAGVDVQTGRRGANGDMLGHGCSLCAPGG